MTVVSVLIRLYPRRFRDEFAREMLTTYNEAAIEHRLGGKFCYRLFAARELGGLTLGLITEWAASSLSEATISRERWTRATHYLTACSLAVTINTLFYANVLPISKSAIAATSASFAFMVLYGMLFAILLELFCFVLGRAIQSEDE